LDHDNNIYSPFPFTISGGLELSASGTRQLPLPPPGLSQDKKEREKDSRKGKRKEREKDSRKGKRKEGEKDSRKGKRKEREKDRKKA